MTWIILLFVLLLCMFCWWFPTTRKWIFLGRSNYITIKIKAKLVFRCKIMKKYGIFIGFVLGFLVAWLLFKGDDDFAWITIRNAVLNGVTLIWDKLMFISPYGRITDITDNFIYILNWSFGWSVLGSLFCIFSLFCDSRRFFLVKLILTVSYFMIMWYLLYFACFIIVKIPIFFNVLSAFAVSLIGIMVGIILLIPILEISEKLNS